MACLGRDIVLPSHSSRDEAPRGRLKHCRYRCAVPTRLSLPGRGLVALEEARYEERGKNIETQDYRIGRNRVRTDFIAR